VVTWTGCSVALVGGERAEPRLAGENQPAGIVDAPSRAVDGYFGRGAVDGAGRGAIDVSEALVDVAVGPAPNHL